MTQASKTVLESALALDEAERAEVAEQLLRSLGGGFLAEIEDEWAAEAEQRLQAYRDGKIRSYRADPPDGSEIDAAWAAEAERRDRAVNEGSEDLLDGDEIVSKLLRGERP